MYSTVPTTDSLNWSFVLVTTRMLAGIIASDAGLKSDACICKLSPPSPRVSLIVRWFTAGKLPSISLTKAVFAVGTVSVPIKMESGTSVNERYGVLVTMTVEVAAMAELIKRLVLIMVLINVPTNM